MKKTLPKFLRSGTFLLVIVTIILLLVPRIGVPQQWILYLYLFFVYLALANMWNLLAGYCGLISLAQPAFIGIAGYVLAILAWIGYPLGLGVRLGGIISAIFALVISAPAFRLRGIYFAIGTLIVPAAVQIIFSMWRPVGNEFYGKGAGYVVKGSTGITSSELYWMALVVGVGSVFLMRLILNSKYGMGLAAIRDNDNTAASSGIDVFRLKLYAFIISAFVTGLAGAVFYINQGFIEPASAFNIQWTMVLMLSTVIGGISIVEGPVLGAAIVVMFHFVLSRYAGISLLLQGIILVGIMMLAPQGIMGLFRKVKIYRSLFRLDTGRDIPDTEGNQKRARAN
jgi:branched-chain amino acid transport system permease protein